MPEVEFPDVWGAGALFAFGGIWGQTQARAEFVARLGAEPGELEWETPQRRKLVVKAELGGGDRFEVQAVMGDLLHLESSAGQPLIAVFSSWHTVVGLIPPGYQLELESEFAIPAAGRECFLSRDSGGRDVLALAQAAGQFALAYAETAEEARARALLGLELDPMVVFERRQDAYRALPAGADPERLPILRKAYGVLGLHVFAAEGALTHAWAMAGRVPPMDFRPADIPLLALALNKFKPDLAAELVRSALGAARADGTFPDTLTIDGVPAGEAAAPGLAWVAWENYTATRDRARLEWAYPRLEKASHVLLAGRDQNANGLLEWLDHADGGATEAGMPNSPRFQAGTRIDAVDLSVWAALDLFALVRMAAELQHEDKAEHWQRRAVWLANTIHSLHWDEESGFFLDREQDGPVRPVRALTGFLPLLLPVVEPDRLRRLAEAAKDPHDFGTVVPLPTVAAADPGFSGDAWAGLVWPALACRVVRGFAQHGRKQLAGRLGGSLLDEITNRWRETGCLWEFYDPQGITPPAACPRLGPPRHPPDPRKKLDNRADAASTAAAVILLLL